MTNDHRTAHTGMDSARETPGIVITASGERIVEMIPGTKKGQPKDRSPVQDGQQNPAAEAIPSLPPDESSSKPPLARNFWPSTRSYPNIRWNSRPHHLSNVHNVHATEDTESDSEFPYRHQRPRATGNVQKDKSLPRRHIEVLKNDLYSFDAKQDRKILKKQKEINRLEKESHRNRLKREEKARYLSEVRAYDKDISERLKRPDGIEREEGTKRAEKRTEELLRKQKLEEAQLQAQRKERVEAALLENDWKELKTKIEKEEMRARIRKELRDEEMRRKLEEFERIDHEKKIRSAAVEDYKLAEKRRLFEEERERRQLKQEYRAAIEAELGYSLEQVKDILTKTTGKKAQRQIRGSSQALSATVHDVPSGDEADVVAP
ncbi:uncharacterized protein BO87DRAFT_377992 [Aspergillus neoniger CBS 115656]|uniref:Uncharacterized protein n=1 Tax=Aspergillus neoniger (strain CBS 115656) TaxID=1448310 RepID=A0A318YEQ3_ASPNB|nr:hypothetical protein BO87DRAFT_377992 [Aspergillus neoniger CBS 115656]PYH32935.1 hypothetical protein BO87DRAFT_377992 [Aspergillus neoniger CBS 115656]